MNDRTCENTGLASAGGPEEGAGAVSALMIEGGGGELL